MLSISERKRQALFAFLLVLFIAVIKTDSKYFQNPNNWLSKFSSLKVFLAGYTVHYVISHSLSLMGLGPADLPEHHYHENYLGLRKILTGLDAGIVSSLHVRPKWFR